MLDPDRLAAGSTTGADIRIVATFTADDGNTVITAVDTCGEEDISATSPQESVTHVGFASAVNATLSHQHFEHFSYPETPTDSDPIQCSSAPGSMTGTLSITSCSTRL